MIQIEKLARNLAAGTGEFLDHHTRLGLASGLRKRQTGALRPARLPMGFCLTDGRDDDKTLVGVLCTVALWQAPGLRGYVEQTKLWGTNEIPALAG